VNEDYHLSGCETMQLADVLENILPPFPRSQGVSLLMGFSLQLQMRMFIT
jgi:hypothetical protein